jgi:pimeloyl-ACP methyl ester carboxylesterase
MVRFEAAPISARRAGGVVTSKTETDLGNMPLQTGLDLLRLQGDVLWACTEFVAKAVSGPLLQSAAPKGDGMSVMTIPGFAGPEFSLQPLNQFLRANGYAAHSWGLGTNRGIRDRAHLDSILAALGARLCAMAGESGRPVALIGQSLGGLFARELARRFPREVDRVITLGSPVHFGEAPKVVNAMVARMMALYTGRTVDEHLREVQDLDFDISEPPPGVPLAAIYSLFDGVVPVQTTRIPARYLGRNGEAARENIEIVCSHAGMAVNPLVLLAVADRLAADKKNWVPFDPANYAAGSIRFASRWFYPTRMTHRPASG